MYKTNRCRSFFVSVKNKLNTKILKDSAKGCKVQERREQMSSPKLSKLIVNDRVRVAGDEEQIVKEVIKNQLNTFDKIPPMGLLWQQRNEQS